ncbi:MAG: TIGR02757 family protein [Bacteroidales bacterium]
MWTYDGEQSELKDFLDEKTWFYNRPAFIEQDPVQVPHQFSDPEDIEIAAFLTAVIAWGRKETIIANALRLVDGMPGGPHEFLIHATDSDLNRFRSFVHRTFNGVDCVYFLKSLRELYRHHGGLKQLFEESFLSTGELTSSINHFREVFFRDCPPGRTSKHLPDVQKNSGAKRINMFLRWMVRRDRCGVDFGLWDRIPMNALYIPLDVHTGNVARKLGLLERRQNDWKSVRELTGRLKRFDPGDPVKYDFALYGLGAFENF